MMLLGVLIVCVCEQLPAGAEEPSCYMYIYGNSTEAALQRNFTKLFELQERVRNGTGQGLNIQRIRKVFRPLRFFHILYVTALF
jgi:hypothetical protein